jgi:two-component system sensor histidine kinase UhpB
MRGVSTDIQRLAATFNRMLERLERERRRSGEMVLAAQEEERKRIARDLHDEVNQALTALLLRIEAMVQDAPPALQAELAETKSIANRAMGELLDLARQLRPTALDDHGLVAALRTHVREQDRRGPARASFWADPSLGDLPPDVQVVIYRVAQEALINAARHSGATRIEVGLERRGAQLRIRVADDGRGLPPSARPGSHGTSFMGHRAATIGGRLHFQRGLGGRGTAVVLDIPLEREPLK